jgi:hypothetical protein
VVTGKFGYSLTPPDLVKSAVLKLVTAFIRDNIGDTDVKEITAETLGEYSVNYAKISELADRLSINATLGAYKRVPKRPKSGFIVVSKICPYSTASIKQ